VDDIVAAVDIGTNSVHLVVARVAGPHAFEVLAREKEMIRLGSGAGDMKHLDPAAVERAVAALLRFRQVAEVHGARVVTAVATSAVREAENRAEFVRRALDVAGVDVEVISGFEEARLIYLGVLQALPVYDQRLLLLDIGGGSTELLVGQQGESLASRSFKLGAIRLTERFFATTNLHPGAVDSCRRHVRATTASFAGVVRRSGFDVAVGSSGTIGALCSMAAARAEGRRTRTLNAFVLSRDDVGQVIHDLVAAPTPADRAKLPGLEAHRADIILAGALICEQVLDVLGVDQLTFSDYALREGVLLDTWQRRHGGSLHHLSDLRRRSVLHLAELMDEDRTHTGHVAELALELFDATADRHGLGDDAREYLEAAALLCNVGLFLSHAAHHKHSYYVIRNSEHLTGFTDREIELIAQIARYHRKSAPKGSHAEFASLSEDDQRTVRICAGLLRVAIALDRSHDNRIAGVRVGGDDDELVIEATPQPDADVALELFSAGQRKDLLEDTLGVPIDVVSSRA
jgi:exopolyphosphatase / guanosine-5'-triphosphate,3'-diphosphate pyrophosphatase